MPSLKIIATAACLALPLGPVSLPAQAATAHNSQAGAFGPTSNICAATPYFNAGDCLSTYVEDSRDDALPPPARYRPRLDRGYRTLPPLSDD